MNDHTVVAALADSSDSTTASRSSCPELLSPYTVVRASQTADGYAFSTEPYAVFFAAVLPPIFAAFDACVEGITSVSGGTEGDRAAMATFLRQFRAALGETDPAKLEPAWAKCDELWMDVQGPIQVVHDIEDGYSDPLRAKQGPDFSLRFLDSTVHLHPSSEPRRPCYPAVPLYLVYRCDFRILCFSLKLSLHSTNANAHLPALQSTLPYLPTGLFAPKRRRLTR